MNALTRFFQSFFDIRHSIKAKLFACFALLTIGITGLVSLYWYHKTVSDTTGALVANMEKSLGSSLLQIENLYEDIRGMHTTVLYETNSFNYIVRDSYTPPSAEWFQNYNRLYTNLRTMGIILSRTIAGTGVYKADGSTCVNGTIGILGEDFLRDETDLVRIGKGDDVLFFVDKPLSGNERVKKYIYVGRTVMDKGEERAVIITRVNEGALAGIFSESVYPDGFVLLLDRSGQLIYDSSPGLYSQSKEACRQDMEAAGQTRSVQGFTVYTAGSDHTGLTIISAVSNAYIRESSRTLQAQLLILFGVIILVVAAISMLVSNQITKGLQSLAKNMKLVGDGSMAALAPVPGDDEVGRLSTAFLEMTEQIGKLLRDVKDNERQKRMMEIKVLRAQISPHFLYNSLNTINYLAMLQSADNIHVVTSSLIDLLQGAVNIDDVLIRLPDEIKYVRSYINIQQYRFPREVDVSYQIDPDTEECMVPKMILQPIVENAMIHGLRGDQADASLQIKAYAIDGGRLMIRVTDNGVGMSEETIRSVMSDEGNRDRLRFSGIGIGNVDRRIKLQFGEEYGVFIHSRESLFTTVEIALPVVHRGESEEEPPVRRRAGEENCK